MTMTTDERREKGMDRHGAYKYPAWCQMEEALASYEEHRKAYLETEAKKLGLEGERYVHHFNRAADTLVKGVQALSGVGVVDCLLDTFTALSPDSSLAPPPDLLEEHVCITFGWEAMGMLCTARERFWELLMFVKERNPSPKAKAFLQRVARCYLFGFDAECVIMCRAVLDREFDAEISCDDVVTWWRTTDKSKRGKHPPFNLWERIQAAFHVRRIDAVNRDAADEVRDVGNKAVHQKPAISNSLDYIRKTVQVLDALRQGTR
jgi:hypothetical protein